VLDGSLGHQIADLATSAGAPDAIYRDLIGRLAVEVQSLTTRADVQRRISQQAVEERASMTGVSLDEEMAALVAAQRAYEASSRVLTTVDEMLEVLINRTGVVGR
jgi:flagellar hook-associated protein 1 FlgK